MPTHEVIQLLFAFCIGVACGIIICMIFTAVKRKNNEDNEAIKPGCFIRSHIVSIAVYYENANPDLLFMDHLIISLP